MTMLVLTSFAASSAGDRNPRQDVELRGDRADAPGSATDEPVKPPVLSTAGTAASDAAASRQLPAPAIDWMNFNQRVGGSSDINLATASRSALEAAPAAIDEGVMALPGEANARRERAVHSPINVFSFDPGTSAATIEPTTDASLSLSRPRADLLADIPEQFASLALAIASEERVDPNWVLSIMRAENAGFDPQLVSSAGAIGLMQVMPKIGEAFGAHDLTDPEQNIRAGTRFLRVLIDKYRNPVLIASAYNAGEPSVDVRQSIPLIQETADYVTRAVGSYTGTVATSPSSPSHPGPKRPADPADRARSSMLVFSVADPLASVGGLHRSEKANHFGDPVKIVKEEVLQ